MTVHVDLQTDSNFSDVPKQKKFQKWADAVFTCIANKLPHNITEVCIRIVDKTESARLNETYRHKSGPTNVLSFPHDPEETLNESLGDLAICAELVAAEASQQNVSMEAHWAHLTVHGILHLLGYDHMKEQDAIIMEGLEIQILKALDIKNPYHD